MIEQTSNAGPFRLSPDGSIAAGESETINTREITAGPRDQRGYLKKWYGSRGGFDYVQVTNTTDLPIEVHADGGAEYLVPPASSVVVTGQGPDGSPEERTTVYTFVRFENPSINPDPIGEGDVSAHFGNGPRPEESNDSGSTVEFDPLSMIPGITINGR